MFFLGIANSPTPSDFQTRLIDVARLAVLSELGQKPYSPAGATPPKAVFVTIERHGAIRGRRGDLLPRTRSFEQEVALAAEDAAAQEPRS